MRGPAFAALWDATPRGVVEQLGRADARDRTAQALETCGNDFTLLDRRRATSTADLDADAVRDVLLSIYRPLQSQPP